MAVEISNSPLNIESDESNRTDLNDFFQQSEFKLSKKGNVTDEKETYESSADNASSYLSDNVQSENKQQFHNQVNCRSDLGCSSTDCCEEDKISSGSSTILSSKQNYKVTGGRNGGKVMPPSHDTIPQCTRYLNHHRGYIGPCTSVHNMTQNEKLMLLSHLCSIIENVDKLQEENQTLIDQIKETTGELLYKCDEENIEEEYVLVSSEDIPLSQCEHEPILICHPQPTSNPKLKRLFSSLFSSKKL